MTVQNRLSGAMLALLMCLTIPALISAEESPENSGQDWTRIEYRATTSFWEGMNVDIAGRPRLVREATYVWDVRPLSTEAEKGREYTRYLGVIRDVTATAEGAVPEEEATYTEYLDRVLAAARVGEATALVDVDRRGMMRAVDGNNLDLFAANLSASLEGMAMVLWPPLPEPAVPLEASMEWDVPYEGWLWIRSAAGGRARCDSIRLWEDGTVDAAISEKRKNESREIGETSIIESDWRLTGLPLHVVEGRLVGTSSGQTQIRKTEKEVRILSGGLPVWGWKEGGEPE